MTRSRLIRIIGLLGLCMPLLAARVPTPREHLGFTPGDDYRLADYAQITGYFEKLAQSSDRIRWTQFGASALGKPMYVAFISSPENLRKLDRYRQISRQLALGRISATQAEALAQEGKAIVWIDSGLHASEVAPAQQAPDLAYRMLTDESAETEAIRRNVILMQVPVINPDGLDWIAHWYAKNVGTPYESAPLPWLYQKYAGHDNNRDWFMLNLAETRAVTKLLFQEWFPQIVYNQHQSPTFPARIFVPPYAEPLNPNIPAAVMEGINVIGSAMKERFARENKTGVLSYWGYDAWWNGGLRSAPAFHNMHGILTETALYSYATPHVYEAHSFPAYFPNGIPTREPSVFYQLPWKGGRWGVRDAIDYMLTADFAILDMAAARRTDYLRKSYQLARASIESGEKGAPYAYVVVPEQWDRPSAMEFLERLAWAGVEIRRARAKFRAGGKEYPEGSYVLPAAQPFRPYLLDLMEPQRYPEIRAAATGPTKRPYDIAGWTLRMQMGVAVDRIEQKFEADLSETSWSDANAAPSTGSVQGQGDVVLLDHRENASFVAITFMLDREERVLWGEDGAIIVDSPYSGESFARADNFARHFGVRVTLAKEAPKAIYELKRPRAALYQSWVSNADEGWTEWVLDRYRVPYTVVHNEDIIKGGLRARFHSLILPSQTAAGILKGTPQGERSAPGERGPAVVTQRPEYAGGIGAEGLAQLERFVREGGTLIALDTATEIPLSFMDVPVRNVLRAGATENASSFYSPGSLLRVTVDPRHPLGFGMPAETIAFSTGGEAFDITEAPAANKDAAVHSAVRFAAKDLLASGWVSGERAVLGKHALVEARLGAGRVILFGFRPQFRGQPYGTFKLLLNAIYWASAQRL